MFFFTSASHQYVVMQAKTQQKICVNKKLHHNIPISFSSDDFESVYVTKISRWHILKYVHEILANGNVLNTTADKPFVVCTYYSHINSGQIDMGVFKFLIWFQVSTRSLACNIRFKPRISDGVLCFQNFVGVFFFTYKISINPNCQMNGRHITLFRNTLIICWHFLAIWL